MVGYQSEGAGGIDLHASEDKLFASFATHLIPTGIKMKIPNGYVGIIKDRSGMAVDGWETHAGVLDSDFRGEVKVLIENNRSSPRAIWKGDRIAQLLIVPIVNVIIRECDELDETKRGGEGFGSTGK
jgi:dUTP pyrophosphatase